jgi:hypothetical protein
MIGEKSVMGVEAGFDRITGYNRIYAILNLYSVNPVILSGLLKNASHECDALQKDEYDNL